MLSSTRANMAMVFRRPRSICSRPSAVSDTTIRRLSGSYGARLTRRFASMPLSSAATRAVLTIITPLISLGKQRPPWVSR